MAIGRFALYRTANRPRDEDELLAQPKQLTPLRTKASAENNSPSESQRHKRGLPAGRRETILIVDDEWASEK
jgi:hypothetical protein